MTGIKIAILIGSVVFVVVAMYGLHRLGIYLEKRGYIYYKEKPVGGGAGVLFELDKLTRPTVEHTLEAMETEKKAQENDGE